MARQSKQRVVLHPDVRCLWSETDFGPRRELVRLVVARVEVLRARRGHQLQLQSARDPRLVEFAKAFTGKSPEPDQPC